MVLFESDPRYGALIPPEIQSGVIEEAVKSSVVLTHFTRQANMTGRQAVVNLRDELPTAAAVDGFDEPEAPKTPRTYMKPVTTQSFKPLNMYAGEFAAIKIFRDADLADALAAGYDVIRNDLPLLASQFGAAIDRAVIWGISKPPEWADIPSLWRRATDNDLIVEQSSVDNTYTDIFGMGGVRDKILLTGYRPNGIVAALETMGMLQGLMDKSGRPLFVDSLRGAYPFSLGGFPLNFSENGAWDPTRAYMLMADFSKLVYRIREDLTWRTVDTGTIVDAAGVTHNLAQQNKTALIMHMRLGWQVIDPVNQLSDSPNAFAFYAPIPQP